MLRDLKSQNERDKRHGTVDVTKPFYITGTFLVDPDTGKILDVGFINGYDEDGDPKYGCVNIKGKFGSTIVPYKYGMCPPYEEIRKMKES